jgi:two-component system sensor histidine kinase AtoS
MKNKIIIGLIVLSLSFTFGGFYITQAMNRVVSNLQEMMDLQHMGFQGKTLLAQIKVVQSDLLLKDSPHAVEFKEFLRHSEAVSDSVGACHRCHHPSALDESMARLREKVDSYLGQGGSLYTVKADAALMKDVQKITFVHGEELLRYIESMFHSADEKIATRTSLARKSVAGTRELLIGFVIVGPLIILLVSIYFLTRFTRAVTVLAKAISKVKGGYLDYRITESLNDEFGELATAFNDMGASLKEQCRRVESIQQRYRMLFESAADAIFILEAEGSDAGRIVSANTAAALMHGYSVDELVTMHIKDLDDPKAAGKIPGRIRQILNGEWLNATVNHRKKDGTVFPVEVSAGLLEYDGHKYVLAFDRDITERVKAEEALQRVKQLAMVGEMAAGLAHEIKNPLAGIKVSIEILASELVLAQEDKEVFLRVIQEVNRIENLLKNLLSYARPPKPHLDAVDLKLLLKNSVKNAEMTLRSPNYFSGKKKGVNFTTELATDLPAIAADFSQLQQIVLNLLLNGIEAIPEDGTITVKAERDQAEQVRITISDTGKGFDEEGRQKAFQPFYTTKPKGNGLGLAITKRLVEQHRGRIDLTSSKGEGATFVITLPVNQQQEGAVI